MTSEIPQIRIDPTHTTNINFTIATRITIHEWIWGTYLLMKKRYHHQFGIATEDDGDDSLIHQREDRLVNQIQYNWNSWGAQHSSH